MFVFCATAAEETRRPNTTSAKIRLITAAPLIDMEDFPLRIENQARFSAHGNDTLTSLRSPSRCHPDRGLQPERRDLRFLMRCLSQMLSAKCRTADPSARAE